MRYEYRLVTDSEITKLDAKTMRGAKTEARLEMGNIVALQETQVWNYTVEARNPHTGDLVQTVHGHHFIPAVVPTCTHKRHRWVRRPTTSANGIEEYHAECRYCGVWRTRTNLWQDSSDGRYLPYQFVSYRDAPDDWKFTPEASTSL